MVLFGISPKGYRGYLASAPTDRCVSAPTCGTSISMTRPVAVTKSARLLRKLSGADAKRQNHQSRALNKQEHAED
jgi:hypothetical protein